MRSVSRFLLALTLLSLLAACGSEAPQSVPAAPASGSPAATSTPASVEITEAQPLEVVKSGYGITRRDLGYAFLVRNPNAATTIGNSEFRALIFDDKGTLIKSDSSFIYLVLPGQTVGVAGTIYLPEDATVARLEIQIEPGKTGTPKSIYETVFAVEEVAYKLDSASAKVSGLITNPLPDTDVTKLRVAAILYDEKDAIVGGGFTFLDIVPANGKTAAEIYVYGAEKPARAEMHTLISAQSKFEAKAP